MPGRRGSSLKNRELYEELRDEGASKEKAARISNAVADGGRKAVGRTRRQVRRLRGLDGGQAPGPRQASSGSGLLRQTQGGAHLNAPRRTERRAAGRATTGPGAPGRIPGIPARARRAAGSATSMHGGSRLRDADRERIHDLVIPPAWEDVWISVEPYGHIQAVGVDDAGRRQYLYHPQWRARRDRGKFARALDARRGAAPRARAR